MWAGEISERVKINAPALSPCALFFFLSLVFVCLCVFSLAPTILASIMGLAHAHALNLSSPPLLGFQRLLYDTYLSLFYLWFFVCLFVFLFFFFFFLFFFLGGGGGGGGRIAWLIRYLLFFLYTIY